jgi:carbon storage regulator CsrA
MLVLTRKNRESVVIGRPGEMEIALEITVLEIEGGRVRLGFEADNKMPIHRREVWDRICHGNGQPDGIATVKASAVTIGRTLVSRQPQRDGEPQGDGEAAAAASRAAASGAAGGQPLAAALARMEGRRQAGS